MTKETLCETPDGVARWASSPPSSVLGRDAKADGFVGSGFAENVSCGLFVRPVLTYEGIVGAFALYCDLPNSSSFASSANFKGFRKYGFDRGTW